MNVAAYVAQFLISKNVHHVFGYQGGAILKLVDEMIATEQISFVQHYHEQGAAFAADAYSRIKGTIGVAIATSGPGATNLITGIVNAQLDSIPTLFITGQDYLANITADNGARQNGFQDLDISTIVESVTKYAVLVTDPAKIRYELECAYYHATQGRPGAVLLDIPIDVQFAEVDVDKLEGFTPPQAQAAPEPMDLSEAMQALQQARRPLILVGGGVRLSDACAQLDEFVRLSGIPVISTLNGLDLVERGFGFAGLHGHTAANLAAQNADLLLVLGARLGQRQVGKIPQKYTKARIIHIDIDPLELRRVFPQEIAIQADLKVALEVMNSLLASLTLPDHSRWRNIIANWTEKYHHNVLLNREGLDPVSVVEKMMPFLQRGAVVTCDVGQNQMWVAQAFRVKEGQRLLNSVGLGSMGYSLPAAIGAKVAESERQVVAFMGDGGLQINLQELMLLRVRRLGIKCVVFNNNTLGMIREVQLRYYKENYYGTNPSEYGCVNLQLLAQAYGLGYRRIQTLDEVMALEQVFADSAPYIIEVGLVLDSKLTNRYDEAACFEAERLDD
ncbi:thiamine pyrophosphate-binding protein [Azonexus fungiphilus]|uniref:thiamine pyrophosphate-binding protein n=1 Tax=Azonexus fungiphilus TaxID=146940 RepID=UPI00156A7A37|nr:thiamine pyrophosphate-binding protein [Azonexus fungiphilus]NHC08154.1 thiamine pyrophosphate-binding protein [Azonexus fungiphilus]